VLARTGDWAGSIVADGVPVAWSPDGSQIAYTRVVGDPGSSSTLYVRPILGGDETSVVTIEDTRGVADQLAWSPDGTKIVVPLQAPESSKVYSFDPKTAGVDALPVPAPTTEARMSPAGDAFYDGLVVRRTDGSAPVPVSGVVADWSRDGQRLLIAGRGPNGGPGLSVLDLRTRAQTSLLDGNVQDAAWSPDERRIAFVRDQKLGVLDVTSGKVTMVAPQITAMFLSAMLGGGYVGWSPDGRQIAVGEWRAEGRATNGVADVYLVDVSSGQATKLAASGSAERYFTFSPDGHNLAYLDNESSVTVLDIATKKQRVIQQSGGANFAWSGDDGIILDTQRGIVLMQLDGTSRLLVADTGGCRHSLMGWSGTRLIFTELCTHRGL
jgi:Tol biopolymer transport system component